MIDERMEEQAALYVLGALTPEETGAFESALGRDVELQQFVTALRSSRDALAGSLPALAPPPALKQKILDQIAAQARPTPAPASLAAGSVRWFNWLPWALAACLAGLCAISVFEQKNLRQTIGEQAQQLIDLNQLANGLRNQAQNLQTAVATLRETNRLANLRIAMLNSMLADSPKAVAVSLWDDQQQRGVFLVQNLKPLAADRDYQLWVMDPKYPSPVSAGVFQVDAQGNVRLQFKADKPIDTANKFAVTEEPKGGLPTPTLKNLVLLGG
jgi:anti-sigma-K factor RskA